MYRMQSQFTWRTNNQDDGVCCHVKILIWCQHQNGPNVRRRTFCLKENYPVVNTIMITINRRIEISTENKKAKETIESQELNNSVTEKKNTWWTNSIAESTKEK